GEEDEAMTTATGDVPESRPISPLRPALQERTTVRFTPRRPRHQLASPSSGNAVAAVGGAGKPRFPSLLKREASNASFLDNYPASLVPEPAFGSTSPSSPSRDDSSASLASVIVQTDSAMDHATVAAAVLNMSSSSDNS
ncbi:hypothetical protein BGZ65_012473, partial [Modicella reniformis]